MKNRKAKKGFTIIELVIVIAVIGILAAVLIPTFSGVIEKANLTAAKEAASNAYTQYLAETAGTGENKANVCIQISAKTGEAAKYIFHVTNGSLDLENNLAAEGATHTEFAADTFVTITIVNNKITAGLPSLEDGE